MKKILLFIITVMISVSFYGCGKATTDNEIESETETQLAPIADTYKENESYESYESTSNSLSLEAVTSEYVEPDFKVVYTLADAIDYFEPTDTDTVEKSTDESGRVTNVVLTDSDGQKKGDITVKYEDDCITSCVSYYSGDEVTEKIIFIFYDEDSIDIMAHADNESNISLYLYNRDGTFNSYIDGSGFSSLIAGTVLEGIGGALSQ